MRNRRAATAGLIVGLVLFATGVLIWRWAPALDTDLHSGLRVSVDARVLPWLMRLTDLGGSYAMIPLGLAACAWLVRTGDRPGSLWLLGTVASGRILVEILKLIAGRSRPPVADRLVDVTSLSFPSAHSAGSMLTAVALCFAFGAPMPTWLAAISFAVAIGATRVALGVHWTSDVLAGWGFGLAWASGWSLATFPNKAGSTQ